MNRITKLTVAGAVLLSSFILAQAADKKPDATFDLSGSAVAVGVGYEWGSGTLHYNGANHPFTIQGLSILNVGGKKIEATGEVYNLGKLEDFAGKYSGLSAGAALVYGASSGVMQNNSGVVIRLRAKTTGAEVKLAGDIIEVKLR